MNIDDYRAMKAQEEANQTQGGEGDVQAQQEPVTPSQEVVQEQTQVQQMEQPQDEQTGVEQEQVQEAPTKVKFGEQEFEVEELIKAKERADELERVTKQLQAQQESAQTAQVYYEAMMSNPEYAKAFAEKNNLPFINPQEQAVKELEKRYNDLLLEREIDMLKVKYDDFNPQDVIKLAIDKQINNLEDAYLLSKVQATPKQTLDPDALREQIRQEVLNELKSDVNTSSLIGASGSGAKPVQDATPQLSHAELKVARGLGISPEEYIKYKNAK